MGSHCRIARLLCALAVAVMLTFSPDAGRTATAAFDSTYCTAQLNGTWSAANTTCTIPSGHTGTVASGTTLFLYYSAGAERIVVSSGATLNIAGTVYLYGGGVENNGSVTITVDGTLRVSWETTYYNNGYLLNYGTLNNNGTINVAYSSDTLRGVVTNYSTLNNNSGASINNSSTGFTNHGTINSAGGFANNAGAIFNERGQFTNTGTSFFNSGQIWIQNSGSLTNSSSGAMYFIGGRVNLNSGTSSFTNNGTLDLDGTSDVWGGGPMTNTGQVTLDGRIDSLSVTNQAGAVLTINQSGTLEAGNLATNGGTINNYGTIDNSATFSNTVTGVVQIYGTFANDNAVSTKLYNWGTINAFCDSVFEHPEDMTFEGNAVVDLCVAPQITSADHATFTAGTAGTFAVTATGSPTPGLTRTGDTLPSGLTFTNNGNGTAMLAGTPAAGTGGLRHFTFTADNDVSPNATQAFTLTVNQAPAITSANSATFTAGTAGTFTVAASGYPAPTFTLTSGTLPTGVTLNATTGVVSGTPAAGSGGSRSLTFRASNNVSPAATQAFTLTVNQAPAITSANSATFTAGTAGTFTVASSGYPAPTFTLTSGTLPTGVTLNATTGVVSGTPAAGSGGSRSLTFRASNNVSPAATQAFTLTVNQAPAITSANSATFTAGTAGTFTVAASGYPAPTFTLTSGTLPTGVTLNATTGVLSGTPAAGTGGIRSLTFRASNNVSPAATQAFTLTVNQAPAITSANSATFTAGTAGTFTVAATGYPAPTYTLTGGTLPTGVTLNATTGVLSGTPAAGTGGIRSLTFRASNNVSPAATQAFTLIVNKASTTTTLVSSANPSVPGQSVTFTASVTSTTSITPTGTLTFTVDSTAVTRTLDAAGRATYSTSALALGSHTVTAEYGGDNNQTGSIVNGAQIVNTPVPTITSISPTSASVNASGFTLTVTGTNFVSTSVALWNGSTRTTMYVSSTKLTAAILQADLSTGGTANVTVFNPAPGGGTSDPATFTINSTAATVTLTSSCNPCILNQTVRMTATVTSAVGASTRTAAQTRRALTGGTITFQDDGNDIAGCVGLGLNGGGQAVCTTTLPGGAHTITAQYSGDGTLGAASGILSQRVDLRLFLPLLLKGAP